MGIEDVKFTAMNMYKYREGHLGDDMNLANSAISLQLSDLVLPAALIYATVVVLSDWNLICLSVELLHKGCRPNRTASLPR